MDNYAIVENKWWLNTGNHSLQNFSKNTAPDVMQTPIKHVL